jgi:thiamine biosynthesis lipoprotein
MRAILSAILLFCWGNIHAQQQAMETKTLLLMGSRFDLTVVAKDHAACQYYLGIAEQEITRIENLISDWRSGTEVDQINKNAGIKPVKVSWETFQLIERSKYLSKITEGAFDISYAALDRIWKFDGTVNQLPDPEMVKASVSKIGYQKIMTQAKDTTVFLELPGMKIGFGSNGKGYAADKARMLLQSMGVEAGIVNASGDLTTWGKKPDGTDWMVGITNPLNKEQIFSWLPVVNSAIATSGNYEKYIDIAGKRYSHIIDPRTGYPVQGVVSVSVLAPSAELCDALATSVFVLGVDAGLNLINQLKGVSCIIVDDQQKVHTSNQLKLDPYEN